MKKDDRIARSVEQARRSAEAADVLEAILQQDGAENIKVEVGGVILEVPRGAIVNLLQDLQDLSWGRTPTRAPADTEIGTQEAADLLNVSRPYVVKLLETGVIPFRKVGNRRRIRLADVVAYLAEDQADRMRRLDEFEAARTSP